MTPDPGPWTVRQSGRGVRERGSREPVPQALSVHLLQYRELLQRWVAGDNARRGRAALMKAAGGRIEEGEALCAALLAEGWIELREQFERGTWQWERLVWRDQARLQALLGVAGAGQRAQDRLALLAEAREWLLALGREGTPHPDAGVPVAPDLLGEIEAALDRLADERLRIEALQGRIDLLQALARWQAQGQEGHRRDFALHARGTTKGISEAEWQWLQEGFDLERLRISRFAFTVMLAGEASLHRGATRIDLGAAQFLMLPLGDLLRVDAVSGAPAHYWLIENRASFERQASARSGGGELLLWLPGRPSAGWLQAVAHLLHLAPAPARISADADPAGVDIACTAGALWQTQGLPWSPHRMGVAELEGTSQQWALNAHDAVLLARLLARPDLPGGLRALCEVMQRSGRKAEQEGWL